MDINKIILEEKTKDRWGEGIEHHPESEAIMEFIGELDFKVWGDSFCWKWGGDGDNGETLMYQLDAYFENKDKDTAELLEMIRGLSANVQVLMNVIHDPNGGSPLAKSLILATAENTVEKANDLVKKYGE